MSSLRLLPVFLIALSVAPGCFGEPDEFEGDFAGECSDDADNDQDGLFDCDDDDCAGSDECEDVEDPEFSDDTDS